MIRLFSSEGLQVARPAWLPASGADVLLPAVGRPALPSIDAAIGQCERHFRSVAALREKIVREPGHYRIALDFAPLRGTKTGSRDAGLSQLARKVSGVGMGETVADARRSAQSALAEAFLRSIDDGRSSSNSDDKRSVGGAALLPPDFPTPGPQVDVVQIANIVGKDKAGTFLKTYCTAWKCSELKERWLRIGDTFHYALSVDIPDEMKTAQARERGVSCACGIGSDTTKLKARSNAKVDLVNRLLPHVKNAESLAKGRPKDAVEAAAAAAAVSGGNDPCRVDFPESVIHESGELFSHLANSGIFGPSLQSDARATDPNARHGTAIKKQYPHYTSEQLDSVLQTKPPPLKGVLDSFAKSKHLPIFDRYGEILKKIESSQVTVLSAATGSGKTTQVPQFILWLYAALKESLGPDVSPPSVIVTQPRRIAAISVAQRIAAERAERFGHDSSVGYQVRFQSIGPAGSNARENGRILLCTAGILLKRMHSDPDLLDCSHLIIDEVHERDASSDTILMLTKGIMLRRPDIRVVLMSATLEADKYVAYFAKDGFKVGTVADIGGTSFPVQSVFIEELCEQLKADNVFPQVLLPQTAKYLAAESTTETASPNNDPVIRSEELCEVPTDIIGETVGWIHKTKPPGAILCFLPGWDEIVAVQDYLVSRGHLSRSAQPHKLFLLHSAGPQQVTDDLFARTPEYRKIILATNIAESSITIPDAVYVIDGGKQKTTFYDAKHRMNVLETCWISRSNMKQRMGRAGRCQPGTYYSMLSRGRAEGLLGHFPPELSRLNLDEVCLGMRAAGVRESCEAFLARALDPPDPRSVRESVKELQSIEAFGDRQQLTPLGRLLSLLPIHPRTGKMLVVSSLLGCVRPIETIVAAMGERLHRSVLSPESKLAMNGYMRRVGTDSFSDHLTMLSVFSNWLAGDNSMLGVYSEQALQRLAKSRNSIHHTLQQGLLDGSFRCGEHDTNTAVLRFVLTSGLYPDIATFTRKRNVFRLSHMKGPVVLSLTSINALPPSIASPAVAVATAASDSSSSNGNGSSMLEEEKTREKRDRIRREMSARPAYYVYDELFDAGTKRISRTTAVDPIWTVLFGERVRVTPLPAEQVEAVVDDCVRICGPAPSVNVLAELRHHYRAFLQFMVSKRLAREPLLPREQHAHDTFLRFLVRLITEHTNIHRSH